jgi:pyruvyltransferase
LLFRYAFPPPNHEKTFKFGIIPHYIDQKSDIVCSLKGDDVLIIDINQAQSPATFVDQIHQCEVILSSSLHGIIISDSYTIPAYHVKFSDNVIGDGFKFRDYYASVKRPYDCVDARVSNPLEVQFKRYTVDFDFDGYLKYVKTVVQIATTMSKPDALKALKQTVCYSSST